MPQIGSIAGATKPSLFEQAITVWTAASIFRHQWALHFKSIWTRSNRTTRHEKQNSATQYAELKCLTAQVN